MSKFLGCIITVCLLAFAWATYTVETNAFAAARQHDDFTKVLHHVEQSRIKLCRDSVNIDINTCTQT